MVPMHSRRQNGSLPPQGPNRVKQADLCTHEIRPPNSEPDSCGTSPAMTWLRVRLTRSCERQALPEVDAAHFGVGAHVFGSAVGNDTALVQHRDLLRDRKYDLHIVLGEEQRQRALPGDAF